MGSTKTTGVEFTCFCSPLQPLNCCIPAATASERHTEAVLRCILQKKAGREAQSAHRSGQEAPTPVEATPSCKPPTREMSDPRETRFASAPWRSQMTVHFCCGITYGDTCVGTWQLTPARGPLLGSSQ